MRFATESRELESVFVATERRRAEPSKPPLYRNHPWIRWRGPWRLVQQDKRSALWRRPCTYTMAGEVDHIVMGPRVDRAGEPDLEECRRYHQ